MCLLRDLPLRAIPLAAPCCSAAQSAANRRKLKTPQTWSPKELGYLKMFPHFQLFSWVELQNVTHSWQGKRNHLTAQHLKKGGKQTHACMAARLHSCMHACSRAQQSINAALAAAACRKQLTTGAPCPCWPAFLKSV